MRYLPLTDSDRRAMLAKVGVADIDGRPNRSGEYPGVVASTTGLVCASEGIPPAREGVHRAAHLLTVV